MRKILVLLSALLGMSLPVMAQDPAAEAIEGAWVVSVGNQPRDRFLIVKGASTDKGEVLVRSAVYGWIDGKGKRVGDWKAKIGGDTINLSFLTPADSLIKVAFSAVDTSVLGDMLTKSGRKFDVRMTRLDAEEFSALRAAASDAKAEMARGATVSKSKATGAQESRRSGPRSLCRSHESLTYIFSDRLFIRLPCHPCCVIAQHAPMTPPNWDTLEPASGEPDGRQRP